MKARIVPAILVLGLTAWLWACAGTSPPTRYYLLNPIALPANGLEEESAQSMLSIGIGPVTLPAYLDRPQIVTRRSTNQLRLADFDRWGESLQPMVTRVLRENLIALLPTENVAEFPFPSNAAFEYQITAEILRFDAVDARQAILAVRWSILRFEDRQRLHSQEAGYTRPVDGPAYSDIVRSLNLVVEDFSRDVATVLKEVFRRDHGW